MPTFYRVPHFVLVSCGEKFDCSHFRLRYFHKFAVLALSKRPRLIFLCPNMKLSICVCMICLHFSFLQGQVLFDGRLYDTRLILLMSHFIKYARTSKRRTNLTALVFQGKITAGRCANFFGNTFSRDEIAIVSDDNAKATISASEIGSIKFANRGWSKSVEAIDFFQFSTTANGPTGCELLFFARSMLSSDLIRNFWSTFGQRAGKHWIFLLPMQW